LTSVLGRLTLGRRLANLAFRRRVRLLDKLNENADFLGLVPAMCRDARAVDTPLALYRHVNDTVLGDVAVDYLEFGVYEGWSISQWAEINRHANSRFVGFDTFTGLPEDWNDWRKAGAFDVKGRLPQTTDSRITFVPRMFQQTLVDFLRGFKVANQMVVHIDCDLYSSTLFSLTTLDRHMPPGTIVVFDEFYDVLHEFAAYRDYVSAFIRRGHGLGYTPAYVQVALRLT